METTLRRSATLCDALRRFATLCQALPGSATLSTGKDTYDDTRARSFRQPRFALHRKTSTSAKPSTKLFRLDYVELCSAISRALCRGRHVAAAANAQSAQRSKRPTLRAHNAQSAHSSTSRMTTALSVLNIFLGRSTQRTEAASDKPLSILYIPASARQLAVAKPSFRHVISLGDEFLSAPAPAPGASARATAAAPEHGEARRSAAKHAKETYSVFRRQLGQSCAAAWPWRPAATEPRPKHCHGHVCRRRSRSRVPARLV